MEYPSSKYYETKEQSEPIAKEILEVLVKKEISYLCALDVLEIAKDKLLFTYPRI